jgi:hypothetical protein
MTETNNEAAALLRAKREDLRWHILRTLDAGRPQPVAEGLIMRVVGDIGHGISPNELRRELDYLRERGLVHVHGGDDQPTWLCHLTRYGIDIVEYSIPCEPGIARPKRYW